MENENQIQNTSYFKSLNKNYIIVILLVVILIEALIIGQKLLNDTETNNQQQVSEIIESKIITPSTSSTSANYLESLTTPLDLDAQRNLYATYITPTTTEGAILANTLGISKDAEIGGNSSVTFLGYYTGNELYRISYVDGYKGMFSEFGYFYLLKRHNDYSSFEVLTSISTLDKKTILDILDNYKQKYSTKIIFSSTTIPYISLGNISKNLNEVDTPETISAEKEVKYYTLNSNPNIVFRISNSKYSDKSYYNYYKIHPGSQSVELSRLDFDVPSLTFLNLDGKSSDISQDYMCGNYKISFSNCIINAKASDIGSPIVIATDKEIGSVKLYRFKDVNNPILKKNYEKREAKVRNSIKDGYATEKDLLTYEGYIKKDPILIVEDEFGISSLFVRDDLSPYDAVEPIIYLYPRSDNTLIDVKVGDNTPHTSWPLYNNGWTVEADKNGKLKEVNTDWEDNKLFYEIESRMFTIPNSGDIVSKGSINEYLDKTLKEYGLNEEETRDFIEAWADDLDDKPYYFIGFLSSAEVDRLLPLEVNPKPDTMIRIEMYYKGLDSKDYSHTPRIKPSTPTRKGFTLVEWGGLKR